MSIVIHFLIVIFIIIISYQLFLATNSYKEGLDDNSGYKNYDTNDPNNAMILSQQNAGNIEVLKKQMDKLTDLKIVVTDLSGNVTTLNTKVDGLAQSQQDYLSQNAPSQPVAITGVTS